WIQVAKADLAATTRPHPVQMRQPPRARACSRRGTSWKPRPFSPLAAELRSRDSCAQWLFLYMLPERAAAWWRPRYLPPALPQEDLRRSFSYVTPILKYNITF